MGGLGNQMFQYAAARKIALANNASLKLDISDYQKDELRQFRLDNFNIKADVASATDLKYFYRYRGLRPQAFILNFFQSIKPSEKQVYIKENGNGYNEKTKKLSSNVYLEGYWQSEKYFEDIERSIRQEFTLKKPFDVKLKKIIEKIEQGRAVAIHIRRGDYLSVKLSKVFETCSSEYYAKAIKQICVRISNPHFFIFSDDINWAKKNLPSDISSEFISQNNTEDFEDLILMSKCQHNIIANSSFSWWGAWLNQNPDKIIIAPQKRFKDDSKNSNDYYPTSWITI